MEKIIYPRKHNEAEIEALLWYFLKKRKIDARLQVCTPRGHNKHLQLDLVVFKNKEAICIVECKSWSKQYSYLQKYMRTRNTRQIKRYEDTFGLPVFVIGRFEQINFIMSKVAELL